MKTRSKGGGTMCVNHQPLRLLRLLERHSLFSFNMLSESSRIFEESPNVYDLQNVHHIL